MVINDQEKNRFSIDIDKFNIGIRKYLYKNLKKIWKISEERLSDFCIHLGIRENTNDLKLKKELEGAILYLQLDNPDRTIQIIDSNMDNDERWRDELLNHIKDFWPDCRNSENTFLKIGSNALTCGNAYPELQTMSANTENYDVLWAVCNKGDANTVVHKLIMQVLLYILANAFRDINQIRALEGYRDADEILKQWKDETEFEFTESYVKQLFKTYNLPDKKDCERLALQSYEKRECQGKILLADPDKFKCQQCDQGEILLHQCDNERDETNVSQPIFNDIDYTRKMLEVCRENTYLLVSNVEKYNILGFVRDYKINSDDITIEYKGIANWRIYFGSEEILCHKRGDYYISKGEYTRNFLDQLTGIKTAMLRYNEGVSDIDSSGLNIHEEIEKFDPAFYTEVITGLERVEHGALLIIALDAEDEAERLCDMCGRGTRIEKTPMTKQKNPKMIEKASIEENKINAMLTGLASVDGAVLIDLKGYCHAFGVILDGEAIARGKFDQGSRHNSARNYIAGKNRIAIIISEDKDKGIEILYGKNIEMIAYGKTTPR